MPTFDILVEELLAEEGGRADDPEDSGGLTKFGISQKAYPKLDIESLTEEDARKIYKRDYWNKMQLDAVPEHLRRDLFFAGVNMGIKNPLNRALQKIVGATPDGVIGKKTVDKIARHKDIESIDRNILVEGAIDYYADLADKRPKDRKFLNGWMNRVVDPKGRPFGSNRVDLRSADIDEIKSKARSFISSPMQESQQQRQPISSGIVDELVSQLQEMTKSPQRGSQTPSEPRTQPDKGVDKELDALLDETLSGIERRLEGERKLEQTFEEVTSEEEPKKWSKKDEKAISEIDRLLSGEVIEVNRQEPTPPPKEKPQTIEGKEDGSKDPIFGIF